MSGQKDTNRMQLIDQEYLLGWQRSRQLGKRFGSGNAPRPLS